MSDSHENIYSDDALAPIPARARSRAGKGAMGVFGVLVSAAALSAALSYAVIWFAHFQSRTASIEDGQQSTPAQSTVTKSLGKSRTDTLAAETSSQAGKKPRAAGSGESPITEQETEATKQTQAGPVSSPSARPSMTAGGQTNGIYVAGSAPGKRSPQASSIKKTTKDADWYAKALAGLTRPYPPSMKFLEDQGAWYTPFNRPGMTGPYDIRSWHDRFNQ